MFLAKTVVGHGGKDVKEEEEKKYVTWNQLIEISFYIYKKININKKSLQID